MMAAQENSGLSNILSKDYSKEFNNAVQSDKYRQITNDAKMKAVTSAQSYDEYVGFVKTAHLKPIDNLKLDDLTKQRGNLKFNRAGDFGSGSRNDKAPTASLSVGVKPAEPADTLAAFERDWRRNCKTPEDKFDYITKFDVARLQKVFKVEIAFGLLSDVLSVMDSIYTPAADTTAETHCAVFTLFESLSTLNKFDFAVDFVSKKEKAMAERAFDKLAAALATDAAPTLYTADGLSAVRKKYLKA